MKHRQAISKLRAASVLLATALMLSGALSAGAAVITVPDDYLTIQEAVNAAESGDTVYVRENVYYENVSIAIPLILQGESRTGTIIDGGGVGNCLTITGTTDERICNLTVQNGAGYGIYISDCLRVTVADCDATTCTLDGIVLIRTTEGRVTNCYAHNNSQHGVAVKMLSNDCIVEYTNASANGHCGIGTWEWCTNLTIKQCHCEGNDLGIAPRHTYGGSVLDCTCVGNSYAGIHLDGTEDFIIEDCTVSANHHGFWIVFHSHNNTIRGCDIEWNTASGVGIGGPDVTDHHFYHNHFIHNVCQVSDDPAQPPGAAGQTWDDGYPSGGNFWSDYDGVDMYHGPDQNLYGSDDIGDTPYAVTSAAVDHYPICNGACPVQPMTWTGIKSMFR